MLFRSAGTYPIPLSQEEVDRVMSGMKSSKEDPKVQIDLKIGDVVRVTEDGNMKGYTGPVVQIDAKRGKVKFRSDMLGGAELETDYKSLEKI